MKKLFFVVLISFVFLSQKAFCQSSQADRLVIKGNNSYTKGDLDKAEQFYLEALQADSNNVEANLHVGIVLLEQDEDWKALPFLEKAYTAEPAADDKIHFYLALAYQNNYEFQKALDHFEEAKKTPANFNRNEWNDLLLRVEQSKTGLLLQAEEVKYHVENMGPEVNSSFRDHVPVITPSQDKLFFTSNRRAKKKAENQEGKYFMDIYFYNFQTNTSHSVEDTDKYLSTSYDDMVLSFDDEGKNLLVYNESNFGDIFISKLTDEQWSKPVSLGNNINSTGYGEVSASLSPDGNKLFFSSNRRGGLGGTDIYISERDISGRWQKARNLGNEINTKGNEEAPFISADGNVLFFSSDGYPSIGGMDIFYSVWNKEEEKWNKPENMGLPVNSPQNDLNFVLTKDGLTGYYSAIHSDTYGGEDIYKVTVLNPEGEDASLLTALHNIKRGGIAEIISVEGQIMKELEESQVKKVSATTKVESATEIRLLLRNIYFEMDEKKPDPAAYKRLDDIAAFMEKNQTVKLELSGHTDDTGSENYNMKLSEERAVEIFKYLTTKGINPSRITTKGYGKSMPLATNDDETEGRELNRRVEFKFIYD